MFKKLKSIFIEEDDTVETAKGTGKETPKKAKSATQASTPKAQSSKPTPAPTAAAATYDKNNPPKGRPQEKFINRLLGALESNNLEGFDYLEYKQSVQNLGNVDMDESTRFKSALAMAKTMGATPQKLISSANHYLKVLGTEESKFLEAFKNQQNRQVSTQNKEVKRLEDGIAQRKAQIKKLQAEIEAGEKALKGKKGTIDQANVKVQATKDGFYHAYHIVTQQIAADLEKMKQYLT